MSESPHFIAVLKKPLVFLPILSVILVLAIFFIISSINNPDKLMKGPGGIEYQNQDLGFSLLLPDSFEYYQTQRKNGENYIDIEIFIPTTDRIYTQEVPGYAKPIVVRAYERSYWDTLSPDDAARAGFIYQGLVNDRAIAVKFWSSIPIDWESKWNNDVQGFIIKGFKLY